MTNNRLNAKSPFAIITVFAFLVLSATKAVVAQHNHEHGVMCVATSESAAMFDAPLSTETEQSIRRADVAGGLRFQLAGSRWTSTRTHPTIAEGEPFFLTYSFVLDGTSIPPSFWETDQNPRPCNLATTMDAQFPGGFDAFRIEIREALDNLQQFTNFRFVEVPDDGAAFTVGNNGAVPTANAIGRGDIRIAMRSIDDAGVDTDGDGFTDRNVLAYNRYPASGGDMVMDAGNMSTFADSTNDFRRLKNTILHELGHGLGLQHVMPQNSSKLMEPALNTAFLGPQEDDIRALNFLYGDVYEDNDTFGTAKPIGSVAFDAAEDIFVPDVTIERASAVDYFKFNASAGSQVTVDLFPVGTSYQQGAQPTTANPNPPTNIVNAAAIHDLRLRVSRDNGSLIDLANATSAGGDERITFTAPADGVYVIRVDATTNTDAPQRYELLVTRDAAAAPEMRLTAHGATNQNIETGDPFNFGNVATDADQHTFFSITNDGSGNLNLTGNPTVTIGGLHPQDFIVNLQPSSAVVGAGETVGFNIGFSPSAAGARQAFVFINNNDDDESNFAFVVNGNGTSSSPSTGTAQIRVFQITPAFVFGKVEVTEGGFSDFPETLLGETQTIFYFIENHGDSDLVLTGNPLVNVVSGASGFSALTQPNPQPTPAGNPEGFAKDFRIRFNPSSTGTKTARVFIDSNATNTTGSFDFTLRGIVTEPIEDCNGNGIDDADDVSAADCNGNGIPDSCDSDTDGDGVPDDCDVCDGADDNADSDGDGTVDCLDACPTDASKTEPGNCGCNNEETTDCGIEVCTDGDDDGDGVCNSEDICPGQDDLLDFDNDGIFDCLDPDISPEENEGNPGGEADGDDDDGDNGNDDDNADDNNNDNTGDDTDNNDNTDDDNNMGDNTDDDNNSGDGDEDDDVETQPDGICGSGAAPVMLMAGACMWGGSQRRRRMRRINR